MGSSPSTVSGGSLQVQTQSSDVASKSGKPFTELDESLRPATPVAKKRPGRFVVATAEHDALLRALLRDNPMPGSIEISLEREPNYFAGAAIDGAECTTIVSLENGRAICAGAANIRVRYINGEAMRVGYLGSLRLDNTHRGRSSILLRAYQFFRDLHRTHADPPRIYLSSILSKNLPAIRFLERNLPEMPTYTRVTELIALMIRPKRRGPSLPTGTGIRIATNDDLPAIAAFLNQQNQVYQFAPFWTPEGLGSCVGLTPADFQLMHDAGGNLLACGAIWDQRPFRQNVIRGYSPRMRKLRPLFNVAARLLRRSPIHDVGHVIPLAFASHLAATTPASLVVLLQSLRRAAFERGIQFLTAGFDSRDPRLAAIRSQFRAREYPSRLYAVRWDDGQSLAQSLDERLLNPDVSLL